jgi:hypothetical protein
MQTHTIEPSRWRTLFDSLSRIYDGSTATLEVLTANMGAQKEIENQPLRGISYDKSGIELHFATRDGGHLVHVIPHPKNVMLEEGDDGLIAAVEIESNDQPQQILHLSAPVPSRLLPTGEA